MILNVQCLCYYVILDFLDFVDIIKYFSLGHELFISLIINLQFPLLVRI